MVNSYYNALGIIFPNSYDTMVPELVNERLMASIPFASRYRLVDFVLSSMVNCGIDNVSVIVRKNYHSLMDHLGSGREWDLTRKNGGLNIVPPYAEKNVKVYFGRIEALASILRFLRAQKEKYVVMSDANTAMNFDFKGMINAHIASGADITLAYKEEEIPAAFLADRKEKSTYYYTYNIDNGRVNKININPKDSGVQNFALNVFVVEREKLIDMVGEAFSNGYAFFERDVLAHNLDNLNAQAFKFDGYTAHITSMKSYYDENMKMLDDANVDALFGPSPVYTKIRDDNPTRYFNDAKVINTMAADGCVIEGEVEDSVLFRGVKVAKGAKVKNCVLMQGTVVEAGADIEYIVTDKNVTITGKELKGSDTYPVFIAKGKTV